MHSSQFQKDILRRAGAPTEATELGIAAEEFLGLAAHARQIRTLYTILDLGADLGIWPEGLNDILQRSGLI